MNSNQQTTDRNTCTKEAPYKPGMPGRWQHPDAVLVGEDFGKGGGVADGDYEDYRCPNCGKEFSVELPN